MWHPCMMDAVSASSSMRVKGKTHCCCLLLRAPLVRDRKGTNRAPRGFWPLGCVCIPFRSYRMASPSTKPRFDDTAPLRPAPTYIFTPSPLPSAHTPFSPQTPAPRPPRASHRQRTAPISRRSRPRPMGSACRASGAGVARRRWAARRGCLWGVGVGSQRVVTDTKRIYCSV